MMKKKVRKRAHKRTNGAITTSPVFQFEETDEIRIRRDADLDHENLMHSCLVGEDDGAVIAIIGEKSDPVMRIQAFDKVKQILERLAEERSKY